MPRRASWRTRAARAVLVGAVVAPVVLAGAQAAGASWTLASPVVPPGATFSYFNSVSCLSTRFCMAVGTDSIGGNVGSLAERWNGSSWAIESTPALQTADLIGVSCRSATLCTAVGEYYHVYGFVTLAERWNGTSWTEQSTPDPSGNPTNSVALTSVDCTAASSCMAMGGTFAEHWNGTRWKLLTVPVPLTSVSCVTGTSCVAVGDTYTSPDGTPYGATWNGTSWTVRAAPLPAGSNDGFFYGVSCTSATTCTAVGDYGNNGNANNALAETWNGTSWTVQTTAALFGGKEGFLDSVSCVRATSCTAVGGEMTLTKRHRHHRTLAEHWNGTAWSVQATVRPADALNSSLASVSCHTQTLCTSVGSYNTSTVPNIVLAEQS